MFKLKHSGIAMLMMQVFTQAIVRKAVEQAQAMKDKNIARMQPVIRGHSQGRLPKGYKEHNPAGTKLLRMAEAHAITMRGRVSL